MIVKGFRERVMFSLSDRFSRKSIRQVLRNLRNLVTVKRIILLIVLWPFIDPYIPEFKWSEHEYTYRDYRDNSRLTWSRQELQQCVRDNCLKSSEFKPYGLTEEDATSALKYLDTYLKQNPSQPPKRPKEFLQQALESSCAVIGGAPLGNEKNFGEQSQLVDSTSDLVIRLNERVPQLAAAEGRRKLLGSQTNAIVIQRGSLRSYERYIKGWGQGNTTLGKARYFASQSLQDEDPIFFVRTECPAGMGACHQTWKGLLNSSLPSVSSSIYILRPELEMLSFKALQRLKGRHGEQRTAVPSTGILAVLMAMRMCKQVNLFAFSGSINGDGDFNERSVWRGHELILERRLLKRLESCTGSVAGLPCGILKVYS